MDGARRRMAIGIFGAVEDVQATIERILAQGVTSHECFYLPLGTTPSDRDLYGPRQDAVELALMPDIGTGQIMLRIYLATMLQEKLVAGALLESAACSVQLHDVAPDPG